MPALKQSKVSRPDAGRRGVLSKTNNKGVKAGTKEFKLTAMQREFVEVCEHSIRQLGFSQSQARIFGVIYSSPVPMAFREITGAVTLSKGSVSQGLRALQELGAVRKLRPSGERRDLFAPATELRWMLMQLVNLRLRAPLEQGTTRLQSIRDRLSRSEEPNRDFLFQRLMVLQAWHRRALRVLPLVQRTLEGKRA